MQGDKKEIIPAIKAIPKDAKEKLSMLFLLYHEAYPKLGLE